MGALSEKYRHIAYIQACATLVYHSVFLRFARHNHDLSIVADALTLQGKLNSPSDRSSDDITGCFLDGLFEDLLQSRLAAEIKPQVSQDSDMSDEDSDENEEEEPIDAASADSEMSLAYSEDDLFLVIQELAEQEAEIKAMDNEAGIHRIGCRCVEDFGIRSDWTAETIQKCQTQFATWLATNLIDLARIDVGIHDPKMDNRRTPMRTISTSNP
jgi:hypothetical protein